MEISDSLFFPGREVFPTGLEESVFDRYSNSSLTFLFFFFLFLIFFKGVLLIFFAGGGSAECPHRFWGEVVGGFSFLFFSGSGVPSVGFGGRGDFVSRLGAGGGGACRSSDTRKGKRRLASSSLLVSY